MEGLINPEWSDLDPIYIIWKDEPSCATTGIWFVEREYRIFGIKEKIKNLEGIIDKIMNVLKNITYDNKENLFESIQTKKKMLEDLLLQYNKLEKNYIEFDKYYRQTLFKFYSYKYYYSPLFAFKEKRTYLSIMNDIQILIKKEFESFCDNYYIIRNSFFDINNYIIKVKKLFNIQN